ncbi:extracellular solute-binding protein [Pseudonocardiaceae bacterium YIM PH 21723]|nr:extracellular solute-binding protein [Pseudonocardiaceae bacterium YIM PH 21723]
MRRWGTAAAVALMVVGCAPGIRSAGPADGDARPATAGDLRGVQIDYTYFTDGPDEQATRDQLAKFETETGAKVKLRVVAFADNERTLQAQLSAGDPPDVARVLNIYPFADAALDLRPYLHDQGMNSAFSDAMMAQARGPQGELLGVPSDLTMNGPLINRDLFDRAGVPVPDRWTWPELVTAARQVQAATGTPYALAMDKSGHRLSTMLSQYGTTFFGTDGKPALDIGRATRALALFAELHDTGAMPKDFWLESGSRYKGANEIFLSQATPVYLSGNWQVSQLAKTAPFRWSAAPDPCAERCGGFPGGKHTMVFKEARHPRAGAALLEWLNTAEHQREFAAQAMYLPTRKDLTEQGVDYPRRGSDMRVFLDEVERTPPDTYASNASPSFSRGAEALVDEVSRMLAGQKSPAGAAKSLRDRVDRLYREANR